MRQIVCSNCMSRVDIGAQQCPYCGHSFVNTNPAGALPVNTLLAGRYTLAKCLRVDGEGVEYEAIDAQTESRVVVKEYIPFAICAARSADGRVIPKAGREVLYKTTCMDFIELYKTLVSLGQAEGLTAVLDLVEANNTAYAVREADEGLTLMEYLDELRIPLNAQEALTLLSPVVTAVETMHRSGLLHRGISPDTVRITPTEAKLCGYATLGLRTAQSELKPHLADGYAAPEQYSVAEFQGPYTDVYSLGALFYFAVTGRTPLPANLRKMQDNLPAAHTILKQIPGYFSAAIASAMRVASQERTQSAQEFLEELTTPQARQDLKGIRAYLAVLTPRHWKIIIACGIGFLLVMIFSIVAILGSLPDEADSSSSSSSSSTSSSAVSSSSTASQAVPVTNTVTTPTFKGQKYEDIIRNQSYAKDFMFSQEYEYSDSVEAGVVIRQTPLPGEETKTGTMVHLVISQGAKTAKMPAVVNHNVNAVIANLTSLGIQYRLNIVTNNGQYVKDNVVDSSIAEGDSVDLQLDVVQLDVAGEVQTPASSSTPTPPSTPTTPTTPPASSSTQQPATDPNTQPTTQPTPDPGTGGGTDTGTSASNAQGQPTA